MRLVYSSKKVEAICTNPEKARNFFGGDESLALGLLSKIQALECAPHIKDIIVQPQFRFHALTNKKRKLDGYFAIDIKGPRKAWRLILQPLDENEKPYTPCNIDKISDTVCVVEISEVGKHYE